MGTMVRNFAWYVTLQDVIEPRSGARIESTAQSRGWGNQEGGSPEGRKIRNETSSLSKKSCLWVAQRFTVAVTPILSVGFRPRGPDFQPAEGVRIMKPMRLAIVFFSIFTLFILPTSADVLRVVVNYAIHPITAEYISRALQTAAANHDQAVLIEINTPGGLVDSTRDIIEKIIASPVPVIIYVTPSGSRAASAGFFILESADVAAMAP